MDERHTSTRNTFSVLLPSDPVWLPFGGSFAGMAIQADQDRVMGLGQHMMQIAGDLQDELDVLRTDISVQQIAFTRQWGAHEKVLRARARAQEEGHEPEPFETIDEEITWLEANGRYRVAQLDYTRMLNAATSRMSQLRRQINLRIIEDTIIRIGVATKQNDTITWSWPYDGAAPDPRKPETLADWPDTVISWIAQDAQEEVQKQLRNPNLNGR